MCLVSLPVLLPRTWRIVSVGYLIFVLWMSEHLTL